MVDDALIEETPLVIERAPDAAHLAETLCAQIAAELAERRVALAAALAALHTQAETLANVAARLVTALRRGNKALVAGNGGSAAEAQHFAAELVGRFKRERIPYAAIALTTDTSGLTAIANDYGYEEVFARQVLGLGRPGDVFLAFSTSGESENLIRAARICRERDIAVVALTGARANRLARLADLAIAAPVTDTALAQELHMVMTHLLCGAVETELARASFPPGPMAAPLDASAAAANAQSPHDGARAHLNVGPRYTHRDRAQRILR